MGDWRRGGQASRDLLARFGMTGPARAFIVWVRRGRGREQGPAATWA